MSSSTSILNEFNKTLDEFIIKMINQFPNETKLKTYHSAFSLSILCNKSTPINLFMGGCLKFSEQIKNRDSEFFIKKKEFVGKATELSSFSDDIGLVNCWGDLSDISKNAIWDYMQTLFIMGEMYINNDTTIINNIHEYYNNYSSNDNQESRINNQE